MTKLRCVFGDEFLTLPGRRDGNVIVFAFKQPTVEVNWEPTEGAARDLVARFGLDFPRYVRRIALDWRRRGRPTLA
jgi:hypothetical protein